MVRYHFLTKFVRNNVKKLGRNMSQITAWYSPHLYLAGSAFDSLQ